MRIKNTLFCKTVLSRQGFSLIELVTFIVVGGIILPASIIAFTNAMGNFMTPDYQTKARFYAEQKIEEVTSQSFDNLTCLTGTPNTTTYTDSPGGYQRVCLINYVQYNSGTNAIEDAGSATYYKKVKISVTPSGSPTYDVSTIITKRPKS